MPHCPICRRFLGLPPHTWRYILASTMTEYNSHVPPPQSSSPNDKKEQRRKIIDAVYERRRLIYKRYIRKLRNNPDNNKIALSFD